MTKQNVQVIKSIAIQFWDALTKLGWHPASELPPVDENLISELVLCWCVDSTFGTLEPKLGRVWRGEWSIKDVKWWITTPEEK